MARLIFIISHGIIEIHQAQMGNCNRKSNRIIVGLISWSQVGNEWRIYVCFSNGKNTNSQQYNISSDKLLDDILSGCPWKKCDNDRIDIHVPIFNRAIITIINDEYFDSDTNKITKEMAGNIIYRIFNC